MSYDWNAPAEDVAALRHWFDTWGPLVSAVDFVPARALFADNVTGFGTRMDIVTGLENLEQNQWRQVWPTIENFHFLTEDMRVGVSPDRRMAMGLCGWTSIGLHEDGSKFSRPGRATVVFARDTLAAPWQGIHTHISLNPGTPQVSYAERPAQS
ncbi:MAG: SnoaL-like domain-containing protein [Rhodospirillaceae bacterium]|jgi:ketosteroid isomerase-like protein|nr:SnoaL-like domain-containing protein [Rhodospirillaceae bacterium]MBT4687588.1 SnoaL-like domain-containing protein [Rhodospirillaceae bacterium]MBT5082052.1 SnoaL-like domain-containing protein [Rhodospirillaceae bacterium]MBT5524740.1 SnoaL-like domain-containing protein [Rhodospirillaceae bacterium]MBT5881219.1 SnoaL-like domain-containing protein [Rhodospirillaceae bacterium]